MSQHQQNCAMMSKLGKFVLVSWHIDSNLIHTLTDCSCAVDQSRVSNIDSDNSQNVGLEDYNNISDGIFPNFTTPSIKISLG